MAYSHCVKQQILWMGTLCRRWRVYDSIPPPSVRRASATAEDIEQRRRAIQQEGKSSPPPPADEEESKDIRVSGSPRSALIHRSVHQQYMIPLVNGTTLRVTEMELADLPDEY